MDGVILVLLLLATPQTLAQDTTVDDIFGSIQRYFKAAIGGVLATKSDTRFYRANLKFRDKAARKLPPTAQFPCDLKNIKLRSDKIPESVHKLRPGDIDIIGAFGDSLSAGTGTSAVTIAEELFVSQRGRAFSGGGERTWRSHLTLPNILKEFNPNLFGFALRASQSFEWEAQFNVAKNGAKSSDTPKLVKELVNKIKRDPRVDVNKHWKMVTLMIGDNDFCSEVCKLNNYYHSLEKHREDLYQVLRYLKQNLPRTLVNIVPPPRLNILYEMKYLPLQCCIVQHLLCPCIRGLQGKNVRETLNDIMRRWQEVEIEIGQMSEWQSEDFAVIVQYFTLNYTFPRTPRGEVDYGYLAPDCFHLSEKGQARCISDARVIFGRLNCIVGLILAPSKPPIKNFTEEPKNDIKLILKRTICKSNS